MSGFVCKCRKPCKDGECKDPKRVIKSILVDEEALHMRVVVAAAMAAHNAVAVYRNFSAMAGRETLHGLWADIEQHERQHVVGKVIGLLSNPTTTPAQAHNLWVAGMINQGFTLGPENEGAKTLPLLVPYNELPFIERTSYEIFDTVVRSILAADITGAAETAEKNRVK